MFRKITLTSLIAGFFTVLLTASASAHVVVNPKQAITAERVTFAMSVPNEHDSPVIKVRLAVPEGLTSVRPFAKQGWNIELTKSGEGENVKVTEITWTSAGATVPVDLKDDFHFGAKLPDNEAELKWKAYETYENGLVVAWDQEPSEAEDSKPYSVTKVTKESEVASSVKKVEQAAADAKQASSRAQYIGMAGAILGLTGIYLATRKK